jgi:hypothetical protein
MLKENEAKSFVTQRSVISFLHNIRSLTETQ